MIDSTARILFPLFLSVAAGYFFKKRFDIPETPLVRIITDFSMPMLVFHSLYSARLESAELAGLAGAASFVVAVLGLAGFAYAKARRLDLKAYLPPVIFINSGFLGIPLMKLWGGTEAMNIIVVYDQVQTMYVFTLGILLVTGGLTAKGLVEIVKSPLVWAIVLGFGFSALRIRLPGFLLGGFEFAGSAGPPLAAFALGASIATRKPRLTVDLAAGLALRMAGGFIAGWVGAEAFGLEGTARTVTIVASSLPSAVFSCVLPERYGVDSAHAGSMVVASTILGIMAIPLAFALAQAT